MPISINGNIANFAFNPSASTNGIQIENGNINGNQSQSKGNVSNQSTNNSLSTASTQGVVRSNNNTSAITSLFADVCDFNLIPFRNATISSTGNWASTGNTQVGVQTPKASTDGQNSLNAQVSSAIPTVSSPPNNFPNPTKPFRVVINGGTTNTPFSGNDVKTSSVNNGGDVASQKSGFAINGSIERSHSIGQDGRIALVDQSGNLVDPTNPAATPGYDANSNTAPGASLFAIFSGNVSVPNFFIPGPLPGDPDQSVAPALGNTLNGNINVSSVSQGQSTSRRGSQNQLSNKNSLGTIGNFNSFVFSQIGIA